MKKGFTLIELVIVVVIVGLTVSGVLAGQELVKQARVRSYISELKDISLAISVFQTKYNGFPGDIINPTRFFPECNTLLIPEDESLAPTISGNGDDIINSDSDNFEQNCTFLHLYNSGIYLPAGPKTGQLYNGVIDETPLSMPPQDVNFNTDSYLYMAWPSNNLIATIESGWQKYSHYIPPHIPNKNVLLVHDYFPVGGGHPDSGFSPYEMYFIDSKLDDGKPSTAGFIYPIQDYDNPECYDNWQELYSGQLDSMAPTTSSSYNITIDSKSCALLYELETL